MAWSVVCTTLPSRSVSLATCEGSQTRLGTKELSEGKRLSEEFVLHNSPYVRGHKLTTHPRAVKVTRLGSTNGKRARQSFDQRIVVSKVTLFVGRAPRVWV